VVQASLTYTTAFPNRKVLKLRINQQQTLIQMAFKFVRN